MQTALLKEYVSKAKDLELSCYEQKLLCDNLEQKLSHINYQRKNKENEKKEFKKFSWINCKRLNFRHGYKNPRPHFCNRSTLIIHI